MLVEPGKSIAGATEANEASLRATKDAATDPKVREEITRTLAEIDKEKNISQKLGEAAVQPAKVEHVLKEFDKAAKDLKVPVSDIFDKPATYTEFGKTEQTTVRTLLNADLSNNHVAKAGQSAILDIAKEQESWWNRATTNEGILKAKNIAAVLPAETEAIGNHAKDVAEDMHWVRKVTSKIPFVGAGVGLVTGAFGGKSFVQQEQARRSQPSIPGLPE
jgi:hypothetical protein